MKLSKQTRELLKELAENLRELARRATSDSEGRSQGLIQAAEILEEELK